MTIKQFLRNITKLRHLKCNKEILFNPLTLNVLFLYPNNLSENPLFCDVSRMHKKEAIRRNGLS